MYNIRGQSLNTKIGYLFIYLERSVATLEVNHHLLPLFYYISVDNCQ
jgi:hypothetical protein